MALGLLGIISVLSGLGAGILFPAIARWFKARATLMEAQAELCKAQTEATRQTAV